LGFFGFRVFTLRALLAFFALRHGLDVDDLLSLTETNDPHPLRVAPSLANLADASPNHLTTVGDHHQLVIGRDQPELHQGAVAVRGVHADDALAAAVLRAPFGDLRALPVPVGADCEHLLVAIFLDDVHADDEVAFTKIDPLYAHRITAHPSNVFHREPDTHAA